MLLHHGHRWDVTPTEAISLQRLLAGEIILTDKLPSIGLVAGVDCGFEGSGSMIRAAVAVLEFPALTLVDHAVALAPARFPYIPGLLSFREIPAILTALEGLCRLPDLILVDGQGYAHPRRCGIASHLGVLLDLPTIGVGKTRLFGSADEPANEHGAWTPLIAANEVIGAVVRSRVNIKPIYISAGHRVSLTTALDYVARCTTRYRLPETTRWAHRLASDRSRRFP